MIYLFKTYLIIFFLLYAVHPFAQNKNEIIAEIGSNNITVEEFQNRFEFMPHLNYSNSNMDSIKKEFLYSLIAEKLWAFEALDKSFDTLDVYQNSLKTLKNLLIKDELYKNEIESKISISKEDIVKGLARIKLNLLVNWILSSDSAEIFLIYNKLKAGASFDSILALGKEPAVQKVPFRVTYAQLKNDYVEDILYKTLPGQFTQPINTDDGYIIFRVLNEEINPAIDPGTEHGKNIVLKTIYDRKAQRLGNAYINTILGGRSVEVDREIIKSFYKVFNSLLTQKNLNGTIREEGFQLGDKDIYLMLSKFTTAELKKPFVLFADNPVELKEFLYYLLYQKLDFPSFDQKTIILVLNKVIKNFIEEQVLVNEGLKQSLDKLSSVKNDLDTWRYNYLAQLMMDKYIDSTAVGENEIDKYLPVKNSLSDTIYQVNILEILTTDLSKVEIVLKKLNDGGDFRELAKLYTERELTKQNGGEFGFFPVNKMGEIGRVASSLNINEVYGPIRINEGYSIIKLIDKREIMSDSLKNYYEKNKDIFRMLLRLQKLDQIINEKTVQYAEKYNLKINNDILKSTQLSELNTFTYRFIGFGGKIAAFPITIPMYQWFNIYRQKNKIP